MHTDIFFIAASVAAIALAEAPDLVTAISQQPSLSTLYGLLGQASNTTAFLGSQKNVTLFAPNDDAFASIVQNGGIFTINQASVDSGLIAQILDYHLVRGVVRAEDITTIPTFVHTYLNYSSFVLDGEVSGSNVTGGQVLSVNLNETGEAQVVSGVKVPSGVVATLLRVIEISVSWLTNATISDVTIFCPNNDAFRAIASSAANITNDQLAEILKYHVVGGSVGYSTLLSNSSLPTLKGEDVTITVGDDGAVFVNDARVINADILIANGVIHVIDEVLSPTKPGFEAIATAPATAATSVATLVPFTSGIQPETSVYSELVPTTSRVAAGLVTASPSSKTTGSINGSSTASASSSVAVQTTNAGMRMQIPALSAAIFGAMAFALDL
ncbi:hypothetical protein LTR78_010638 [Recurvomyces mirabilis]|uniref:FAS1 domain-containing protein n=1 Tax=Recurvomyces mirabilis TaxID=574656 RepID=A0AAE0TPE9_9PEZI|nr:hypothetical protein LTR78_010638 [Recurvomyces mirabilis]KAK5149566.1 hypothetical protein LTS14_010824 [Recurvomyces mirabilis]